MGELREVRSADGTTIAVEVTGAGPPLVAVHGGTADRSRWAPVRDALGEHFTLHLMDRRGRGDSTAEADGYALEREAEDVAAVAAEAGAPVGLLGHSYGALVGLEVLRCTPELIARALLYEPPFDTPGHQVVAAEDVEAVRTMVAAGDREGALTWFYERVVAIDPTPLRGLPIWQARLAAVHTMVREGRACQGYVPPTELAEVDVPVRLLAGTASPSAFGAAARAAAAAIPGATLVWLEGQGHAMIDADPAGFVAHVLDFLA